MRVVYIRGADLKVLSALVDLLVTCYGIRIELYKPRLSRRVEVRISGDKRDKAYYALTEFASKVGWSLES